MSSLLADIPFALARESMQRSAATRRTIEAQADIAAARAAPTEDDVAVTQDLDTALSNAALADTPAVREMGGPARRGGQPCPDCEGVLTGMAHVCPDTAAAIDRFGFKAPIGESAAAELAGAAPLPALYGRLRRELAHAFGVDRDVAWSTLLEMAERSPRASERQPYPALDPRNLPPGAVLLTGNEAAHYRRLQDAARASQAAQNALATAGAELRDAFGALCKAISVEPSKEP